MTRYVRDNGVGIELYSLRRLRQDYPNTSFPQSPSEELLASYGVYPLLDAVEPEYDPLTETVEDAGIQFIAGVGYMEQFSVVPLPTEVAAERMRKAVDAERDRRVLAGKAFNLTGYSDPVVIAGDPVTRENLANQKDVASYFNQTGNTNLLEWRDENNVVHYLTADQTIELWLQGVTYVSAIYKAAWTLKDGGSIPPDYTEDNYWP